MPFQEVVEAEGHLIDSHIMENIFDKVVEYHGRFEVEQFRIGRTNSEPSYLRLKVEAPDEAPLRAAARAAAGAGLRARRMPATPSCATVERDRCAPEDFYSTTNHRTFVRHGQQWIEVENQRMDAMIVVARRARRLPPPARSARGRPDRGGAARHPRGARNRRSATAWRSPSCPTASPRSGRWKPPCGRRRRWCGRPCEQKQKVVVVAGPVVVHTGGVAGLAALIRGGWVHARAERQRAGRARRRSGAVRHLARRAARRRPPGGARPSQPHARHQRHLPRRLACGRRWKAGACAPACCTNACKAGVPFVLAGSLRDDGPLPDTITDMNAAQDAYAEQLKGAGLVLCLGSMLHSIATGNMLPSWVQNRVRGYQPGGGHQGQRPRHRPGGGRGGRCRPVPGSAFESL